MRVESEHRPVGGMGTKQDQCGKVAVVKSLEGNTHMDTMSVAWQYLGLIIPADAKKCVPQRRTVAVITRR